MAGAFGSYNSRRELEHGCTGIARCSSTQVVPTSHHQPITKEDRCGKDSLAAPKRPQQNTLLVLGLLSTAPFEAVCVRSLSFAPPTDTKTAQVACMTAVAADPRWLVAPDTVERGDTRDQCFRPRMLR